MLAGHGGANRGDDLLDVRLAMLALDLLHDDQTLLAVGVDGERGAAIDAQGRMALLDGPLDVLRIMVAAANDDQVLQPAGDVELTVVQIAQVAGAHEGPVAVGQVRLERVLRFLGAVPIALRHAGALDPDLADAVRTGTRVSVSGLTISTSLVQQRAAATDQVCEPSSLGSGRLDAILLQSRAADGVRRRDAPGRRRR